MQIYRGTVPCCSCRNFKSARTLQKFESGVCGSSGLKSSILKTLQRGAEIVMEDRQIVIGGFYRHFKDKYDLINWYFDVLAQMSFKQMGISMTLREGLVKKFEFIKGEGQFFAAAFSSESQNCLMEYDYQCIYQFYCDIIHKQGVEKISEELEFLLRMYCRGSIAMTVEWATTGMKMSPEQLADQLIDAMPPKLYDLFKDI